MDTKIGKRRAIPLVQFQGTITVEQNLKQGSLVHGALGIQTSNDGRVWICLNGVALIRLVPDSRDRR